MAAVGVQLAPIENGTHALGPAYSEKIKASRAREIIAAVLKAKLTGATYHPDNTSAWAREIADEVKEKLKAEKWPRYKYVVQVFIGEQKGEGCRLGCRCFWDANTDSYVHANFDNESIFCVAAAFGSYVY